jgi:tetratricopeptide (TPR) repeat protein
MDKTLPRKAISEALSADWEAALKTNLRILRENPNDIDTLNRLARVYSEIGKIELAKKMSHRVLKLDPYNQIATRSLARWHGLGSDKAHKGKRTVSNAFIEEPGKTKLVNLVNLGCEKNLSKIDCGDEVVFNPCGHRLLILTLDGEKIGALPDALGARLKKMIDLGTNFTFIVKSVCCDHVSIFIKSETTSFPQTSFPEPLSDQNYL